ncbi:MAG: UDP-diphospho-muramoylpentapeptide beta-N-acetylglucosaminyltransferase [Clostridia bacterium]|nr:UDP-diphospho-muramoylpentapeptide beta-N-acetylglucosaminyltransferase [Clostridia bacterium]
MNILILTGKFGMGHWSASQSLRLELLNAFPSADIAVDDFFAYAMPDVSDAMYKGFSLLVTKGSGLYNTYYKCTENLSVKGKSILDGLWQDKLAQRLSEFQPNLIIATHPVCAQLVSDYKEETLSRLPLVTCITDLSTHSEWINDNTDCYLVGSRDIRDRLAEKGVERARVFVTGIPVKPEFKARCHRNGGGERHLLIMGGGLGLLPKKDKFYETLNTLPGVRTTIIAGNNQKVYDRLYGKYENIEVVGFTDRVYDYMAEADLMLSKPGGITLFETIFSELPILAWEPFLQQEINNARFIVRNQIGRIAAKETEECVEAIKRVIYNDAALERMRSNMRRLKGQLEQESLERIVAALTTMKGVCA